MGQNLGLQWNGMQVLKEQYIVHSILFNPNLNLLKLNLKKKSKFGLKRNEEINFFHSMSSK